MARSRTGASSPLYDSSKCAPSTRMGVRGKPGQGHRAWRSIDHDLAGEYLPRARHLELRVTPERNIQALEAHKLRKAARQTPRHEPLHGYGQVQGLRVDVLVGAEVELPGAGKRLDLGAAGNRAAAAPVIEVEVELGHPPDALAGAIVDDDCCGPESDFAQVGAGMFAAARPRRRLGEHLDEIDAAERPLGIGRAAAAIAGGASTAPRNERRVVLRPHGLMARI